MYPSTNRHQSSFEAVQNPSTRAVVRTVLAAAAVPLAVVAVLSYPAIGLATAAFVVIASRRLTADRAGRSRRPFRRGLAEIVSWSGTPGPGDRGDSRCCEDAA